MSKPNFDSKRITFYTDHKAVIARLAKEASPPTSFTKMAEHLLELGLEQYQRQKSDQAKS